MPIRDGWAELRHSVGNGRLDANPEDRFIAVQYDLKMVEDVVRHRGGNLIGGFANVGYTSVEFERLEEPIQLIEQGVLTFIAVADLSRFGRGDKAFVPLERIWLAGGHLLVGDEQDWDIHNPKDMADIKEELLRLGRARDKHARKWRAVAEQKVAQGVPQRVPLGYRKRAEAVVIDSDRVRQGTAYIPDECRALARDIKTAFEMMVAGDNDQVIADWLHERGHRQAHGRRITSGVVGSLRRSVVPKGDVKWDEYVNEGCHEAVVSRELWDQAQRPRSASKRRRNLGTQALSDILRCAGCRYKLSYDQFVDNAGVTRWRWAHQDVPECRARATIMDSGAYGFIERVYLDYVRKEQANIGRARQTIADVAAELAKLEAAKDEAEARYRKHLGDYVLEENEPDKYKVREERYRKEAMAAVQAYADKQQSMPATCPDGDILERWAEMPVIEKRDNLMAKYPIVWVRKSEYLDDDGVIRRMPFHDRLQFVDLSQAAKYELPSRNRKRKGVPAYEPRPVTNGWKVNYVLAPPQRRGVRPVMCQSELYADLKAATPAELLEVETARAHFLEQGRGDEEIRAAWAMTGQVKRQTARQLGIPYHAMPETLRELGLVQEKPMTAQERGRRRLHERRGGTRKLAHEDCLLALLVSGGNVAVAASELGLPRQSLYYRRDKYRIWGWLDTKNVPTDEAFLAVKKLDAELLDPSGNP